MQNFMALIVTPLGALLTALAGFTTFYLVMWWTAVTKAKPIETVREIGTGFVTNFFDTLGIGSFAPTTAIFKFFKIVPDQLIPGTMNVGHTLPTITQAFIYTTAIEVEPLTLILMIVAAVAGSWLGAGIVAGWPRKNIQIGMGFALLVAASLFTWSNLGGGGSVEGTTGLHGVKLVLGMAGNFALGALMTLGIGLYAPCMILVGLLGMNAAAAFPIMMGSCAFLMPIGSAKFVARQAYSLRPALALAIGGIPAVLIAALIIKNMDVKTMKWLVIVVVVIAATMMLRSAFLEKDEIAAKGR
jgi:uncharacterized membrane protein YfcA